MNSLFVPGNAVMRTCHRPTIAPPPVETAPCAAAASAGAVPGRASFAAPVRAEIFDAPGAKQAALTSMAPAANRAADRKATDSIRDGIRRIRAFIGLLLVKATGRERLPHVGGLEGRTVSCWLRPINGNDLPTTV